MATPPDNEKQEAEHGRLTVTVHDEDAGGDPFRIPAGPGEKVGKVIAELYRLLNTSPRESDRLLCAENGDSVPPHADEHLRDYGTGVCSDLVWTYARDTGGA